MPLSSGTILPIVFQVFKRRIMLIWLLILVPCCPVLFCGCTLQSDKKTVNPYYYACDPGTGSSPISVSVDASRLGGTAPLTVFFDATGITGLTNNCSFADNAAYMDATFDWDFDFTDTDSEGLYEKASGFVAAHVFEHQGEYRVRLDVYDPNGETASEEITIDVSDFTGTTYYVAANGNDGNDGTLAHPFLTPEHALSSAILGPNVRVLFRNGDTFPINAIITVQNENGPIIIGAYENPALATQTKPVLHSTAVDSDYATVMFQNCSDIRIIDIEVSSDGRTFHNPRYPSGISWSNDCTHMLKFRTDEHELGQLSLSQAGRYSTIAECKSYNTSLGAYSTSENLPETNDGNALIGNLVYNHGQDLEENMGHTFRLQGGSRYFIAHNIFGPEMIIFFSGLTIRGNSEKVVIYRNIFHGWVQNITPQNENSNPPEYQHHCIMDSNLFIGQNLYDGDRGCAIGIRAKDIVIRNNIIYDYEYGISVLEDTVVGPSQRIKVYNNTFVNPAMDSGFTFLIVEPACSGIYVRNNLMLDNAGGSPEYTTFICLDGNGSFPGTSDYNMFYGGSYWGADHDDLFIVNRRMILDDWQDITGCDLSSSIVDPQLLNTSDYSSPDFCKPAEGSPVIDTGEDTPAVLDFYGNVRDESRDIGACEHL